MLRRLCLAVICVASLATDSLAATLRDVAPPLRKAAECMAKVLKTEPGVSGVKIGVSVGPSPAEVGPFAADERAWVHPFIDYKKSKGPYFSTIRFVSRGDPKRTDFEFMTMLSGLAPMGERPDDLGTHALAAKWRAVCRVHASVLYN